FHLQIKLIYGSGTLPSPSLVMIRTAIISIDVDEEREARPPICKEALELCSNFFLAFFNSTMHEKETGEYRLE
ncbi:hypothetical protein PMAYCL1PPCAC_11136, partial [Pristionchus mayeri]